ncbi:MAG: type II toxin-antitoxin system RelE/ParE family toxin [Ancrocorticia sp.]|uniref:type II toxin-antitoxin system RelE/ParE family toxin n=1 Tax=Ancrocorticia sp. TaxID=2593684 RepID=UPI003F9305F9
MVTIRRTLIFDAWLEGLKDKRGSARIVLRLERLTLGNFGQVAPIGSGLFELKIDTGPGYRIYGLQHGETLILLLCGGDKSTQKKDIARAHQLAEEWRRDMKRKVAGEK